MARPRRIDRDAKKLRERKYRLRGGKGRTKRFIPDADSEFAHMARCFAGHIERNAERLGVAAEKVEALCDAVAAFRAALSRTLQRSTAGPQATSIKNAARKDAEAAVRSMARFLRGTAEASLTDVDRMALNMRRRAKRVRRLKCPQVAPVLKFLGSTDPAGRTLHGGRHILEYRNDFDKVSTARPHGAARLELFVELVPIGEPIPTHPGERSGGRLWYLRSFTTSRFEVDFPRLFHDDQPVPMLVVYWGRWADASGGVGPFSETCVAQVENAPHCRLARPDMPLLRTGEPRGVFRVTPMPGELEAKPSAAEPLALPRA